MKPISFDDIGQACLIISRTIPKQSFQISCSHKISSFVFGTELEIPEGWAVNHRELPSKMGGSLTLDFGAFNFAAAISNLDGLQFSPILLSSSFIINENINCNLQTAGGDPIALSTSIMTKHANTNFALSASNKFSEITYSISSGFLINNSLLFGLGISQDNQFAPFKFMTSFLVNFGLLQFSGNFERLLDKTKNLTFSLGTNFLLDPNNILNFSIIKNDDKENLALGYRGLINDTQINTTMATDGVITSLISRQLNDQITFSTGLSYQTLLGSLIPSIEIHISS